MIIILLDYVNDSLKSHLYDIVRKVFAECFEKHHGLMRDSNNIKIYTSK